MDEVRKKAVRAYIASVWIRIAQIYITLIVLCITSTLSTSKTLKNCLKTAIMKIVPIHYKVSRPVRKYFEIEDDAVRMAQKIDNKDFEGGIHRAAYALAHCQVHENPLAFFVLDLQLVAGHGTDPKLAVFEDRVIINPQIIEAPVYLKEKSIFNVFTGHDEFDGKELIPGKHPNFATFNEGCMSFPHRKLKRINRFNKIKVSYQTRGGMLGLKTHTCWLEGLPSQIFQHEFDHCQGKNIYFEGFKD